MGNAAAMPPAFATAPSATPTIKLLIAKDANVVLYAEAGKDVIDFLLGLLAMPLAATCKLTSKDKDSPLGPLANLYASVERMDPEYMQSLETREALLNPAPAHPALVAAAGGFPSLVQPAPPPSSPAPAPAPSPAPRVARRSLSPPRLSSLKLPPFHVGNAYYHGGGDAYLAAAAQAAHERRGFVRGLVTYTVTDELVVEPMSSISSITLLHRLGVEDLSALEERTVKIGYQEGLEILKASMKKSKTVLTDVFLAKKKRTRTTGDKNGATSQQQEKKPRATDPDAEKELAVE
ncbi:hypothetical protein HU200_055544 [Digitaria exilis]|uniref:Uncharacterized protein n=1 Tax=Digitaria exilis TaxID=1010633 RepID=A0A835E5Q7_9POAL|nr:hypothetical protein HU200_055544 [Digitaria exilis]CAB3472147.1 unnamed protein product [Digitaria exilis]